VQLDVLPHVPLGEVVYAAGEGHRRAGAGLQKAIAPGVEGEGALLRDVEVLAARLKAGTSGNAETSGIASGVWCWSSKSTTEPTETCLSPSKYPRERF